MEIDNTTATKKKEKTVKIRLPRTREDHGDVFVSVNARTWLIQRGVEVEVLDDTERGAGGFGHTGKK